MFLRTARARNGNGLVDKRESIGRWIQGINSLCGLAKVLGVEHRSSQTNINVNAFDWWHSYRRADGAGYRCDIELNSRKLLIVDRIQTQMATRVRPLQFGRLIIAIARVADVDPPPFAKLGLVSLIVAEVAMVSTPPSED